MYDIFVESSAFKVRRSIGFTSDIVIFSTGEVNGGST